MAHPDVHGVFYDIHDSIVMQRQRIIFKGI